MKLFSRWCIVNNVFFSLQSVLCHIVGHVNICFNYLTHEEPGKNWWLIYVHNIKLEAHLESLFQSWSKFFLTTLDCKLYTSRECNTHKFLAFSELKLIGFKHIFGKNFWEILMVRNSKISWGTIAAPMHTHAHCVPPLITIRRNCDTGRSASH